MKHRWVMVADTGFLPAMRGGEYEHRDFVRAARAAGVLALLVVPDSRGIDPVAYRREVGNVPVVRTPRRDAGLLALLLLLHPRDPYVVASRPTPRWLADEVRMLAPDATGILAFSYKSRGIAAALARDLQLPVVIRQHNREGTYHRALAADTRGPRGLALAWDARRIERDERRLGRRRWLVGQADISAADASWRAQWGGSPVIHVPPFAGTAEEAADGWSAAGADEVTGQTVVFLGALDVATNVAALDWFLDQVWDGVRARRPNVTLEIVGRRPGPALAARIAAAPAARLHADVPDLAPYLAAAAVAVNPAVSGAGVNIKLVDYLRAGLPVVSTSHALAGLDLRPGVDLLVADDGESFTSAVVDLLADRGEAARLGACGRARLRDLLDPAENLGKLAALFDAAHHSRR